MGNYVDNFINSLIPNDSHRKLASVLMLNELDCRHFYANHLGENLHLIDDLLDYRSAKLSISDITFDKFESMCDNGVNKKAIEIAFLQYVSPLEEALIHTMVSVGKVSLRELYDRSIGNPDMSIMKFVL